MSTIAIAAREYASRPADERYPSVAALVAAAREQKTHSGEKTYNLKDLRAVGTDDSVKLENPQGRTATLSHWAFGQLARMVGAPAGYLRTLPASIATDAINYGIRQSPLAQDAALLIQAPNGRPEPHIRSVTSDSYTRVWDADLYAAVQDTIVARDDRWTLPPTWSGEPAGAYRGDRDSFVVLTNGGSIVTDPSAGEDGRMYRGLLLRNSEVGAASLTIEHVLYRYICGNHMLWGAVIDRKFRRRHVGTSVLRDAVREIVRASQQYVEGSAAKDEAIIRTLITAEVAQTKDAVLDELRAIGYTREQATAAYMRCEETERVSPRSYWGIAQGTTRLSQDSGYQDDRFQLDQLAAKVLSRGARLVAA